MATLANFGSEAPSSPSPPRSARPSSADGQRVLATVLFTDIVGSTGHAGDLGDSRWRELLEEHHVIVRDGQLFALAE